MTAAALVTGGAVRVGRAICLFLAERGFDVAVHYAGSAEEAGQTARDVRAHGVQAATVQADLLDDSAVEALVPQASAALGKPLTLLVNNASIFEHDDFETATFDSWDRHHGSNLKAPFFLSQAFAAQVPDPATDHRGEPVAAAMILNMIDMRVRKLTPDFATYTLAKYGLWGLTQTAARAFAPRVRVNGIGPGPTLRGGRQSEAQFEAQRAATVLRRGASPDEICTALGFLLDSPGVTGQLMCIDGGQHLGWQTPDVVGVE